MPKHPHRLMLFQKKTWRCTLPGCAFFVHTGLTHVLLGRNALCWECGEIFVVTEESLTEDMAKCDNCRSDLKVVDRKGLDEYVESQQEKARIAAGIPEWRKYFETKPTGSDMMEVLLERARANAANKDKPTKQEPPDEIETIEPEEN